MSTPTPTQAYWKGRAVMYRIWDADGRLIYIGASHDFPTRMTVHSQTTWWYGLVSKIRVQVFPDRAAALAAEAVAIQEEQPVFNIAGTGRAFGDFSMLTARDLEVCQQVRRIKHVPCSLLARLNDLCRKSA